MLSLRSAARLSPTEMTEPRQSTTVPNTSNTKAAGVGTHGAILTVTAPAPARGTATNGASDER